MSHQAEQNHTPTGGQIQEEVAKLFHANGINKFSMDIILPNGDRFYYNVNTFSTGFEYPMFKKSSIEIEDLFRQCGIKKISVIVTPFDRISFSIIDRQEDGLTPEEFSRIHTMGAHNDTE